MTQQLSTSRRSVALASAFVVVAIAAFGVAFYMLDGATVVVELASGLLSQAAPAAEPAPPAQLDTELRLPGGMSEEFALRLWQEQVDSQATIRKLVSGDVAKLVITDVKKDGADAQLVATLRYKDGSSAPGVFGLRKFKGVYYFAYISAGGADGAGPGETPLPSLDEVDIPLLNTMLAENAKSKDIVQEYVDGVVKSVAVEGVSPGPNTATIALGMDETHEESYADLIVINQKVVGEDLWFLARFNKTGAEPKK